MTSDMDVAGISDLETHMLDKVMRWLSSAPKRATSAVWANGASESRGRVLLEYPAHSTPSSLATVLRDVSVCEGPTTTHSCLRLEDGECGLVEVPRPQADKLPEVLDSRVLVSSPVTASSLRDAVSSALPER